MYLQMIINLSIVVALIFAYALALRYISRKKEGNVATLQIMSTLALSAKEKLVVVQIEGERLLLGVTATQINLLTKIEKPVFHRTLSEVEKAV